MFLKSPMCTACAAKVARATCLPAFSLAARLDLSLVPKMEDVAPAHVRECPSWITELLSLADTKLKRAFTQAVKTKVLNKTGEFTAQVPIHVASLDSRGPESMSQAKIVGIGGRCAVADLRCTMCCTRPSSHILIAYHCTLPCRFDSTMISKRNFGRERRTARVFLSPAMPENLPSRAGIGLRTFRSIVMHTCEHTVAWHTHACICTHEPHAAACT